MNGNIEIVKTLQPQIREKDYPSECVNDWETAGEREQKYASSDTYWRQLWSPPYPMLGQMKGKNYYLVLTRWDSKKFWVTTNNGHDASNDMGPYDTFALAARVANMFNMQLGAENAQTDD